MTVEELIANLFETGKPDMRVVLCTDHGQSYENVDSVVEMVWSDLQAHPPEHLLEDLTQEQIDKLERVLVLMS